MSIHVYHHKTIKLIAMHIYYKLVEITSRRQEKLNTFCSVLRVPVSEVTQKQMEIVIQLFTYHTKATLLEGALLIYHEKTAVISFI